ncbi:MAG: hypothetical protein ABR578_11525 [Chromatocurvus sp.]
MNNLPRMFASFKTLAPMIGAWYLLSGLSATAADGVDASDLIENNCTSCHGSEMYTREDRKVNSLSALKTQVQACNTNLNTGMSPEQLEAIAALLNEEYYKFE